MEFLSKLLKHLNLTYDDFLELSKDINEIKLIDPFSLKDMKKTYDRIALAIENKEKIVVYGDYDTDGIMATSILVKCFNKLNYKIGYYVPSRYLDGYGLTKERIDQFKAKGYSLIITVDNGISLFDQIDYANSLGIDVIVTDHHEIQDKLPNCYSILHPTYSELGDVIASGGEMALYLSSALLGYYDDYLLTLAGLSIVSDLMELKAYNRDIVRLAINNLKNYKYLQLNLLNESGYIDEKSFSLKIAPKINSIGRITEDISINRVVNYFVTDDKLQIKNYYAEIEDINRLRKDLASDFFDTLRIDNSQNSIAIIADTKEGLNGLIANKLMTTFKKPTIVFAKDSKNEEVLKGSMRSKKGISLTKFLTIINDKIVSGGGHDLAGGLTIYSSDFDYIKSCFEEFCSKNEISEGNDDTIEISINEINKENIETLLKISPFGVGFPEPKFLLKNIKTSGLSYMSLGKHIGTPISMTSKIIGFNIPRDEMNKYNFVNFIGNLRKNEFNGKFSYDFVISEFTTD